MANLDQMIADDAWDFDAAAAEDGANDRDDQESGPPDELDEPDEYLFGDGPSEVDSDDGPPEEPVEPVVPVVAVELVACPICLETGGAEDDAHWPLICCSTPGSLKWVHRSCMLQLARTPVVILPEVGPAPEVTRPRALLDLACPQCRSLVPHIGVHMDELRGALVAPVVPVRRRHRTTRAVQAPVPLVVPAPVFGFDVVPEVDAAVTPVLVQAGLVSVLALSLPSSAPGNIQQQGELDDILAEFSAGSCIGRDARQNKFALLVYIGLPCEITDVYAHFTAQPAFAGHIGVLRRGHTTAVMVIRSSRVTVSAESLVVAGLAPVFEHRLPQTTSRNQASMRQIFINWCGYGEYFHSDFLVLNNSATGSRPTFDQVQSLVRVMTEAQRANLIGTATMTPVRERTPLQASLVALGEHRLRPVNPLSNCVWTAEKAALEGLLRLDQFTGLENLTLTRWEEHTDSTVSIPFLQYIRNAAYCRKYSLVLLGAPGLGKSPLARSVCLMWAIALARSDGRLDHSARFVECNTVDILRTMAPDMNEYTPMLFDEVSFSDSTQFQHMSVNMAKLLLNVEVQCSLHGRNNDIALAAGQPRVFTSNCEDLLEFVGQGLHETSFHFKAMRKRCFVGKLTSGTVSPAVARRVADAARPLVDMSAGEAGMNTLLR
jgi:hypothetical protein